MTSIATSLVNNLAWSIWCIACVCVYGATAASAQHRGSNAASMVVAWSRSSLEQDFVKLTAGLNPQLKSTPRAEWEILGKLLGGVDARTQAEELNRITRQPPSAWTNKFDELLLELFVSRLLNAGDFAQAERVLTQRCPTHIGGLPIEFRLVEDRGPDGVLMLSRAFAAAGTNPTARVVVAGLSRGFPSLRAQYPIDREFVAACELWAKHPGTNWTLNWDYPYIPSSGLPRTADDPAWKVGLIVTKKQNSAQRAPEH